MTFTPAAPDVVIVAGRPAEFRALQGRLDQAVDAVVAFELARAPASDWMAFLVFADAAAAIRFAWHRPRHAPTPRSTR